MTNNKSKLKYKNFKYYVLGFGILLFIIFFLLKKVFSGQIILPQGFSFGIFHIRYYGLCLAAAVAAGYWLAIVRAEKFGLSAQDAEDRLFWLVLAGFLGARIYHVFSDWRYYSQFPGEIVKVWHGGLSIYGAILVGFLAVYLFDKFEYNAIQDNWYYGNNIIEIKYLHKLQNCIQDFTNQELTIEI